jgi:hypothetical protein
MALKAVVTTIASSATMHDAIDASANTQDFVAFSFNFVMATSSRLQSSGPRHEDEPSRPKDSAEKKFSFARILSWVRDVFEVTIEIAANGGCYETDRGALQDEA